MWFTLFVTCAVSIGQEGIPRGSAKMDVEMGGERLEIFSYKPAGFRDGSLLIVFHGAGRNAEEYRNDARVVGDRLGMIVLAPQFDRERFSNDRYHRGGLVRDGKVAPRSEWTWSAVSLIVDEARRREKRPDMPYYLFGHSPGGQFLARMAGFVPTDARRIVIANPSAYLFPARAVAYPYGFGGLTEELGSDAQIRRYLAQPLTIYLGTADMLHEDLDLHPDASRLGATRFDRGKNIYREAEAVAHARGWEFRWRLVEARGIGHDHRGMLNSPDLPTALFGPEAAAAPD